MNFTDIFVKRPVLASVVSLMILVLGIRAMMSLDLRQYPRTQNTVLLPLRCSKLLQKRMGSIFLLPVLGKASRKLKPICR